MQVLCRLFELSDEGVKLNYETGLAGGSFSFRFLVLNFFSSQLEQSIITNTS